MRRARHWLPRGLIFLNVHPGSFEAGTAFGETLISSARQAGVALDRIVLEITEQGSLSGSPALLKLIAELRDLGVRFAFDDVGVAYSHLPLIQSIRPSFLKISQHFGTAFETDSTKMKIVMNVLSLARLQLRSRSGGCRACSHRRVRGRAGHSAGTRILLRSTGGCVDGA